MKLLFPFALASLVVLVSLSIVKGSPISEHENSKDPAAPFIIGGIPATRGEYPWIVEIRVGSNGRHLCNGIIGNNYHVITTAYCIFNSLSYTVIAGEHNLNADEGSEQIRLVAEKIIHPDFDENFGYNDIAILKLASPLDINFYVRPAFFPAPDQEVSGNLTVAGWGSLSDGGIFPDILHKVDVPLVDHETCVEIYNPYGITIQNSMICAGSAGKGSCQGDDGGPLQNHNEIVFGLVSFGLGCGLPGFPGVFTSIPQFIRWINLNTQTKYDG